MKIEIRTILCPLDFSENSEHALLYARAFAQAHDAKLLLLHVVELPMSYLSPEVVLPVDILERQKEACVQNLTAITEAVRRELPQTEWLLAEGNPFPRIVEMARTHGVDLIVMGTHGRTGLAHALLGSVAEKVVRKAPCPVLTVKHPEHEFVMP